MRNLSKARFNSPERSGEENNKTYFPQLNNKINLHPNFDMPKAFKKHRKNRNKAIRDSLGNFAHKSVMDNHHSQGSNLQFYQEQNHRRDFSDDKKRAGDIRNILKYLKKRKPERPKHIWVPSGPMKYNDGYNPSTKLYY